MKSVSCGVNQDLRVKIIVQRFIIKTLYSFSIPYHFISLLQTTHSLLNYGISFLFLFCLPIILLLTLLAKQRYCSLHCLCLEDDVLMLILACCFGLLTAGSC